MVTELEESSLFQADRDLAWRQYELANKSYEFYWGVALKITAYFYTLTGAIGAFHIPNRSIPNLENCLLIPIGVGIGLALIFGYGALWSEFELSPWFDDLADNSTLDINKLSKREWVFNFIFRD